ncbi:hypothetical protein MTP99_017943 [Tenebrio molitor]|jgi:chromatin accessibility complex protein 1|nr:hypothetical protein MTP99_017943 [Tenebrio molitor]
MSSKPWGSLPVSRVNMIMKSSSEVENIAKESSPMMAKLAELFIRLLAKEGYKLADDENLDYKHVAEVVNREDRYEFLRDIMPRKITFGEYKKMQGIQENGNEEGTSTEDDSGSEDSSSDDSQ